MNRFVHIAESLFNLASGLCLASTDITVQGKQMLVHDSASYGLSHAKTFPVVAEALKFGPNAVANFKTELTVSIIGPHQRWAHGFLVDNANDGRHVGEPSMVWQWAELDGECGRCVDCRRRPWRGVTHASNEQVCRLARGLNKGEWDVCSKGRSGEASEFVPNTARCKTT